MTRVLVNLLWLVPGVVGGSEESTTDALRAVADVLDAQDASARIDLHLAVLLPFADAHPDLAARFPLHVLDQDGRDKRRRVLSEQTWLPATTRAIGAEVEHHAGGVLPLRHPARSVLTVHDLQPLVMPENFSSMKRRWLATMLPRSARRAAMVFTPSDPASASVVDLLHVSEDRVRTVPHGIEPPRPVPADEIASVRQRYRLGTQVVLYPAITYPHKDHLTLVQAFGRLARSRPDVTLVLPGAAGPSEADVTAAIRASGAGDQVRRTGRIPWSDLAALYACATAVAVPSRFEGFGAPALEAMAAGVPVVVADATALPWVVGDADLKFRPGDVAQLAGELARILDQPAAHATLAEAGRVRAGRFSWDRAAHDLAAGYRAAASMGETRRA